MSDTSNHLDESLRRLAASIPDLPDESEVDDGRLLSVLPSSDENHISIKTGVPARYRESWERPTDEKWLDDHQKVMQALKNGACCAVIGSRGGGKTRIACECLRDFARAKGVYSTAMELFLRMRATFNKKDATETEISIINDFANAPLLILDELQERGESDWEDKNLTHIVDKRYANMRPTILIANTKPEDLHEQLGPSIVDRMNEGGGMIIMGGVSHRKASK